jgi:hypothetical protein
MTATKSWAYTTEYGFERITAWRITQERKKYNNESLRGTYWSAHVTSFHTKILPTQEMVTMAGSLSHTTYSKKPLQAYLALSSNCAMLMNTP